MSDEEKKPRFPLAVDELIEIACEYEARGDHKTAGEVIEAALEREKEGKK
tara:strand:- start:302 stop:451 length:150 start_codon:yes stop_codon:yes gene_type:complete